MAEGEVEKLGQLMTEAEALFDSHIAPMCPEELDAPKLKSVLKDPHVAQFSYGGKGVGSHGDGSVQFLARDADCQQKLIDYLNGQGMKLIR